MGGELEGGADHHGSAEIDGDGELGIDGGGKQSST